MNGSHKISSQHLARTATVYVRQSTLDQVRHHHESRRRQYHSASGRENFWKEVDFIDDDLGKSGASSAQRTGFQRSRKRGLQRSPGRMGLERSVR